MAHLYGVADFREAMKLSLEDEATRVRGENRHVAGEVSAALLEQESEGVPATTKAEGPALGEALRAVGLARVVSHGGSRKTTSPTVGVTSWPSGANHIRTRLAVTAVSPARTFQCP